MKTQKDYFDLRSKIVTLLCLLGYGSMPIEKALKQAIADLRQPKKRKKKG